MPVFQVAQDDVTFRKFSDSLHQSVTTTQVRGDVATGTKPNDSSTHSEAKTSSENDLERAFRKILDARGDSPLVDLQAFASSYSFYDVQSVKLDARGDFMLVFNQKPREGASAAVKSSVGNSKPNGGPADGKKPVRSRSIFGSVTKWCGSDRFA